MPRMQRHRNYCFTVNNYTDNNITDLTRHAEGQLSAIKAFPPPKYLVFGKELAPETGTPHLQGFVQYETVKTFEWVQKALPHGTHIEPAKGRPDQAADYCRKDGDFTEFGKRPTSPKQNGENEKKRYERAWALAKEGKVEEIDADIRMRLYGTIKKIRSDYQQVPDSLTEFDFHWYYGASGTGKSRRAHEENPDAYIKPINKWWDGYVDQECVIIEEWSPNHEMLAHHLKQWCDHYGFAAEQKGTTVTLRPKKIIITSNYTIEECFPKPQDHEPLKRRLKVTRFAAL